MTDNKKDFWRWLSEELTHEAQQSRASGGLLPLRPVCLSEVEALGLLLLVCNAQRCMRGGPAESAAGRLVHTLQGHLQDFGTGNGAGGGR